MTDQEALDMIAKGHAALVANRAVPAEPKPPRPPEPIKEVVVALSGLAKAIASAEPRTRLVVSATKVASFGLKNVTGPAEGITVDLSAVQIGNLQVNAVANVEFLGVDLNFAQVRNSKAIRFTRANVHDRPADSGLGFYDCQGVVVTASTFANLMNGIVHDHCDDLIVEGNRFTGLGSDGVTGVAPVGLRVQNNDLQDWNPAPGKHPDAVQLFTTNAKRMPTNIVVSGNRIHRASGGIPQGVFITTSKGFEQFRYQRVTVSDNEIIGAMYNGLVVEGADDVVITGNTVQPIGSQKSWLKVSNCAHVLVQGNAFAQFEQSNVTGLDLRDKQTLTAIPA